MSDNGTSFSIDLAVGGTPAVDKAASSLDVLAERLTKAGAASTAASDAVKAGDAAYRTAETTADRAAKALEKVTLAAEAQKAKVAAAQSGGDDSGAAAAEARLARLNARQSEAATKAEGAKAALDAEAKALDALKAASTAAATEQTKASKALDDAKVAAKGAAEGINGIDARGAARALGKLGGPLGELGHTIFGTKAAIDKLFASFGSSGGLVLAAVGVAAVAAAMVALTVATAAAVVEIAKWSIGLADTARTQGLLAAGIARSVEGGAVLNDKIGELLGKLPATREELSQMATQLAAGGLRGKDLSAALETAAVKAARLKYGPDFAKETLSLTHQVDVLHANIAKVFGGLNIDALLEAGAKLVDLFDTNTESGKAIKVVFESIFQPLVNGATNLVPVVERAFLKFEILAIQALIAIKPFGTLIAYTAGAVGVFAAVVAGVLVGAVALIGAAIAGIIAGAAALGDFFGDLAFDVVQASGVLVDAVVGVWHDIVSFFDGISLAEVGANLIAGLVEGVKAGATGVIDAISGVVDGGIKAAKSLLKINSPSKVFAEIGASTAEGMVDGVEDGSGDVRTAMERMASPADAPTAGSNGKPTGAPMINITVHAGEGAEDIAAKVREVMLQVFEGGRAQLGVAVPNA